MSSRKLLRFLSGGTVYQFKALCFRLDCPSGLHSCVCSDICMGSLPWDLSSRVPGQLVGPRLFGVRGQKECPGSALTLSLPWDCDKREVRSRSLTDCKLPRYDHRYQDRHDFPVPCSGQEISVGGGEVLCFVHSPLRSALAGGVGSPGFTGEAGSSQSTSNALSAVAFEHALVSRVGSSLAPGTTVLEGEGGSVLDGAGPSSQGGLIRDNYSRSTPVL